MRFASFLSELPDARDALAALIPRAREFSRKLDLAFIFFTPDHRDSAADLVETLWLDLDPSAVVGCCAEGVIAADREVERAPGIALLVGETPTLRPHPFHIAADDWRSLLSDPAGALAERLGHGQETRALIAIADPFTTPVTQFLQTLDQHFPGSPLVGGAASAAQEAGQNLLIKNDSLYDDGIVGLSLSGPVDVQTVVSQGCRPIGKPMIITRAKDNVIHALGGKPAFAALKEMVAALPEPDQHLLQHGLLIGRAISEYREKFARGDFLVRGLLSADQESGALSVADHVRTGQTIQFHVRDAATATEDLCLLLEPQQQLPPPAAALLFSCNGRGVRLFDHPCHDISTARDYLPSTPIAGFFAAGEFGPVANKNFIHGHTASLALLRPKP